MWFRIVIYLFLCGAWIVQNQIPNFNQRYLFPALPVYFLIYVWLFTLFTLYAMWSYFRGVWFKCVVMCQHCRIGFLLVCSLGSDTVLIYFWLSTQSFTLSIFHSVRRIVSIVLVRCVIGRARVYAQREEEVNGTCERNEHERRQNKIEKQRERGCSCTRCSRFGSFWCATFG